jgi:DNA polymerase I-like protein with 3'-5' exonuclease and polymerase domains/intein/homing endonuclease
MVAGGNHLSDKAYNLLGKYLAQDGFSADDFAFMPSIRCPHDADTYTSADKRLISKHCREWVLRAIDHFDPKLIIPLGSQAASAVAGRSVKITKVRGVPEYSREYERFILAIDDPARAVTYPQHEPIFASDCKTLTRLVDNEYDMNAAELDMMGKYTFITDLQFLIDANPEYLGFDVETTGLRWAANDFKILTMQFCIEPGVAYMMVWDHPEKPMPMRNRGRIRRQLQTLLQNPDTSVFGQNLKYDASAALRVFGFRFRIDHDTLMLAALIDENSQTKSLDTLTKLYVPGMAGYADSFNSKYDKSRMDLVPLSDMLHYGCGDVDADMQVLFAQLDIVEADDRLWSHYRYISIPGINAFVAMEQRGMIIDEDALDILEEELAISVEAQRVSLMSQVHRNIKRKHLTDPKMDGKPISKILSFTRKEFLLDILFNSPDGFKLKPQAYTKTTAKLAPEHRVPSTSSKDHLPFFFDTCHFTEELAQYVKDERILGTNVRSFRKKYMLDGKIYPIYSLWTAVTGRCLTADAKIVTNFGCMTMGEIGEVFATRKNPHKGLVQVVTHTGALRPVVDFVKNGRRRIYRVETSSGYHVDATSNHPFWTPNGWVELGDLEEGDAVHTYDFEYDPREEEEEWVTTLRHKDYSVSSLGKVAYTGDGARRLLRPCRKGSWGHVKVRLGRGAKDSPVHQLVAEAFLGSRPEGCEVLHLNGLPADNRVSNLVYGTSAENSAHTVLHGRSRRGEVHDSCVYSDELVSEIKEQHFRKGMNFAEIGRTYGINRRYVRQLCIGERRKSKVDVLGTDTVVSIEYIGRQDTFDISVEKDHSFVANNLVVHNTSSRDPNGQNFPKRGKVAKAYRNIFVPPPGFVILEADLSQAELRISADMANDRTMLEIYNRNGDIHAMTAARTMGMEFDDFMEGKGSDDILAEVVHEWRGASGYLSSITDSEARAKATVGEFVDFKRFQAKAINFGFIYGMGWRKFIIYAKTQYGVEFSESEAKEIRETFFTTYGSLEAWHRGTRQFVAKNGFVRSYSGRVRHLPMIDSDEEGVQGEAQRQAINSPVQEFASSLGVMSIGRIDQEVDPQYLAPIGFVHDAIYTLVRLEHIEWGAKTLKYYMESNPIEEWFGIKLKCPIIADVGFGIKGGTTHEMGGLKLDEPYDFTKIREKATFDIPEQVSPPYDGRVDTPEHMLIYV